MYHIEFPGLNFKFEISPVAFSLGSINIRWYGIFIAIGFLLAFLYVSKRSRDFQVNSDHLTEAILVGLITAIIGARLYYIIFYPDDTYIKDPLKIFQITEGGIAIYGAIIGGLLGGLAIAKIRKMNLLSVLDIAALGFLIGQSIGRWGNFTNQEAFGVETSLPWRMISENTGGVGVHPCFLYESLWCALGFILLHLFSKHYTNNVINQSNPAKSNFLNILYPRYPGQIFLLYLLWYGLERFVVEGLRTDSLIIPMLGLRVSQIIAIITVITAITILIANKIKFKNNNLNLE